MSIKLSELSSKAVISTRSGRGLGRVGDLEIDPVTGAVTSVTVERRRGFFGVAAGEELVLRWNAIRLVGEDALLVDADGEELCGGESGPRF